MSDLRIRYDELLVGAGHPTKTDTINRLALVEHNNDGTHKSVTGVTDPWVDVRAFGGVGDGVTDDTDAFTNAIAAATGKDIVVPSGTWLVTGIDVNVKCKVLLSPGATIKLADSTNATVVILSAAGASIKGGKVDGNKANQTSTSHGVAVTADNCEVEGVEVVDTYNYGIYAGNSDNIRILNNTVTNTRTIGIFVNAPSSSLANVLVQGNFVDRSSLDPATIAEGGIKVHGDASSLTAGRVKIIGNDVVMPINPVASSANCIEVWGLSPYSTITGNTTVNGSMGVSVDLSDYTAVTGNTIQNANLYGIEVASSKYCTMSGNTIDGNSTTDYGISLHNTAPTNNTITGNVITNTTSFPIRVWTGADHTTVVGNTIKMNTTTSGIVFGSADHCSASGNLIDGGGVGYRVEFGSNLSISGGSITNTSVSAIRLYANTAVTLNDITIQGVNMNSVTAVLTTSLSGGAALGDRIRVVDCPGTSGVDYLDWNNDIRRVVKTGTPESAQIAGIGSICLREDGGAGTSFYVKESGAGNTGWVGK